MKKNFLPKSPFTHNSKYIFTIIYLLFQKERKKKQLKDETNRKLFEINSNTFVGHPYRFFLFTQQNDDEKKYLRQPIYQTFFLPFFFCNVLMFI